MIADFELRAPIARHRGGVLAQALERAERCGDESSLTAWTLAQALVHCAQSIEYSMTGFPRARSRAFQVLVGRGVKRRFMRRGVMFHNRTASIPGGSRCRGRSRGAKRSRACAGPSRRSTRTTGRSPLTSRMALRAGRSTRRSMRCTSSIT